MAINEISVAVYTSMCELLRDSWFRFITVSAGSTRRIASSRLPWEVVARLRLPIVQQVSYEQKGGHDLATQSSKQLSSVA